jgi:hypothetical protein
MLMIGDALRDVDVAEVHDGLSMASTEPPSRMAALVVRVHLS